MAVKVSQKPLICNFFVAAECRSFEMDYGPRGHDRDEFRTGVVAKDRVP